MSRPVGRPVASSAAPEKASYQPPSSFVRAPKDSVTSSSSRISSSRLDHIASQLTDLDRDLVYGVTRLRLVTGDQLERLFWPGGTEAQGRAARRALRRLVTWRILDRLPRLVGGVRAGSSGFIYCLGPAGHRLMRRQGFTAQRLAVPGDRFIAHTLAVTEVVVGLHVAQQVGDIDIIEVQTEPTCWRGFLDAYGSRVMLKPDLFCRLGSGAYEDRWTIEVDMATESKSTVATKSRRYVDYYRSGIEQKEHGVFPRTVWAVPSDHRAKQIRTALARLPAEAQRLFEVCGQDELIMFLSTEAGS